ncbi:MrcB family domain-containing protein [Paenibacillus apiarius]|uniref:MrcB family domain-containing protein n=1 Tax=Paenibacillus apiarius TaxID=46240 RepID=UPI00300D6DF1
MNLPAELQNIFKTKQKSYKMVLILALLAEMKELGQEKVLFSKVRERFLSALQERERNGRRVDAPPSSVGSNWRDIKVSQIHTIIDNPINALFHIIGRDIADQTIGFKPTLLSQWSEQVHDELQQYAERELAAYYQEPHFSWSLREELQHVMDNYLQAKTEQFKGHQLGNMVRRTIPNEISGFSFIHDQLKVQGSVGQGNWATVPWIAIMDNRVTTTTQRGEYIVYLFAEDMSTVYLTLMQGVTIPLRDYGKVEGYKYLREKVEQLRGQLPLTGMNKDDNIHLTSGGLGYDYQVSTVAYYRYDRDQLPDDEQLIADLHNVVANYKQYVEGQMNEEQIPHDDTEPDQEHIEAPLVVADELQRIQAYIRHKGFSYPEHLIENFYLSLKTKPFVILAGVSGTGKTKLVKLFAEALGATAGNQQFTLIPVRPDWSDPSDLLGYKDLSGAFRPGPLALVLEEAMKPENRRKPYFVCLDEMNLARVEHYFSDVLSVLETQEWQGERIVTTRLLQPEMLSQEEDRARFGDLHIPDNVYLVGTVNMDETTHPFSKKVLDRANTIEFNYIELNQYPLALRKRTSGLRCILCPMDFCAVNICS